MFTPLDEDATHFEKSRDPADRELVRKFFDRQSDCYSESFDPDARTGASVLFRMRGRLASGMLADEAGAALLDLATGTGEITREITANPAFTKLHLNDINAGMLEACKKRFAGHPLTDDIHWSNLGAFGRRNTR